MSSGLQVVTFSQNGPQVRSSWTTLLYTIAAQQK